MYRSLFPRDVFAELDRLQRDIQQSFDVSPSIRGLGRGGFPAINVGGTAQSVEVYAFVPGLDPAKLEVNLERGVLTIAPCLGDPFTLSPPGALRGPQADDQVIGVIGVDRIVGKAERCA